MLKRCFENCRSFKFNHFKTRSLYYRTRGSLRWISIKRVSGSTYNCLVMHISSMLGFCPARLPAGSLHFYELLRLQYSPLSFQMGCQFFAELITQHFQGLILSLLEVEQIRSEVFCSRTKCTARSMNQNFCETQHSQEAQPLCLHEAQRLKELCLFCLWIAFCNI